MNTASLTRRVALTTLSNSGSTDEPVATSRAPAPVSGSSNAAAVTTPRRVQLSSSISRSPGGSTGADSNAASQQSTPRRVSLTTVAAAPDNTAASSISADTEPTVTSWRRYSMYLKCHIQTIATNDCMCGLVKAFIMVSLTIVGTGAAEPFWYYSQAVSEDDGIHLCLESTQDAFSQPASSSAMTLNSPAPANGKSQQSPAIKQRPTATSDVTTPRRIKPVTLSTSPRSPQVLPKSPPPRRVALTTIASANGGDSTSSSDATTSGDKQLWCKLMAYFNMKSFSV